MMLVGVKAPSQMPINPRRITSPSTPVASAEKPDSKDRTVMDTTSTRRVPRRSITLPMPRADRPQVKASAADR